MYNFPSIDLKTQRNLLIFNQNIRTVYPNICAVHPNKYHVTTHPVCTDENVLTKSGETVKKGELNADLKEITLEVKFRKIEIS